jgi:trehalose utilization protein
MNVIVWTDLPHDIYASGLGEEVASAIREHTDATVRCATIEDPGQGLDELEDIDVLVWWGHMRHDDVTDAHAAAVQEQVLRGMGLIALHASARSKPLLRLLGTTGTFKWREEDDRELIWPVDPAHPIAQGIGEVIALDAHEMYGEPFDIPAPDELVFISNFSGGEVLRSGCGWRRGRGRIFYFSPGHQTDPVYHHPAIRRVLGNAVGWAHGSERAEAARSTHAPAGWFE